MKKIKKIFLKKNKLSLENEGQLALFFIGIGSAFSKIHYQTNLLIIKGKTHLLIDCGTTCPAAFWSYGMPIFNVGNLLITHSHADHVGGLEEVALMGRYFTKKKPRMIITQEYEPVLWNNSLKGGASFNECDKNGHYLTLADFFDSLYPRLTGSEPRPVYETAINDLKINLYRTMHIPDSAQSWQDSFYSYGIVIDDRIIFTSDTRHDPDLIYFLLDRFPGIETIFHDCQLFAGGVHTYYGDLVRFPAPVRKMMFLTHYGDNYQTVNPGKDQFAGYARQGCYYIFG